MGYDNFDDECNGQMSIDDLFPAPKRMFAVSKIFARAKKKMTAAEYKTFAYALSTVDWTKPMPETVEMDKKALAKVLGISADDPSHLSRDFKRLLKDISSHSQVEFDRQDKGYISGDVINTIIMNNRNKVILDFNKRYTALFSELTSDFLTMWSDDIFAMDGERSITFYEFLRAHSDTTKQCEYGLGVKAMKEMWNIPKDGPGSYVRKDGKFDRPGFEKGVIEPICDDLKKCAMIQLVVQPNGKYYEKIKAGKKVLGYKFYWNVSDRPRIAKANEMPELRENFTKDPKTFKIAKDIANGKKKNKAKDVAINEQNRFNNFQQNSYSKEELDDLEKFLLEN